MSDLSTQRRVSINFVDLVSKNGRLYAVFTVRDRFAGSGIAGVAAASISPDETVYVPINVQNMQDLKSMQGVESLLQDQLSHAHDPKDINRFITSRNAHGRVIWQDGFEDVAFKWKRTGIGTVTPPTGNVSRSYNRAYSGRCSLHVEERTTVSTDIRAFRSFSHHADRISLEVMFTFSDTMRLSAGGQAVVFELWSVDGTTQGAATSSIQRFRMEYRPSDQGATAGLCWVLFDGTGPVAVVGATGRTGGGQSPLPGQYKLAAYDNAETNAVKTSLEAWHHFKMIVDRKQNRYVGMELDDQFLDLSNYQGAFLGQVVPRAAKTWSVALGLGIDPVAGDYHAYFDDVIVADETLAQLP